MNEPGDKLTKAVEALQKDAEAAADFERVAGGLEAFYQRMLAAGVARKERYNIVTIGEPGLADVEFLIRY